MRIYFYVSCKGVKNWIDVDKREKIEFSGKYIYFVNAEGQQDSMLISDIESIEYV
jgi:hypothetical protein